MQPRQLRLQLRTGFKKDLSRFSKNCILLLCLEPRQQSPSTTQGRSKGRFFFWQRCTLQYLGPGISPRVGRDSKPTKFLKTVLQNRWFVCFLNLVVTAPFLHYNFVASYIYALGRGKTRHCLATVVLQMSDQMKINQFFTN